MELLDEEPALTAREAGAQDEEERQDELLVQAVIQAGVRLVGAALAVREALPVDAA